MKTTKYALVLALGLIAVVARPAHAGTITTYTINLTAVIGSAPVSGSFTYDSTNPLFTNFQVIGVAAHMISRQGRTAP